MAFTAVALDGTTLHFRLTETVGYLFVLVGSAALVHRLSRAGYTEQWQTLLIGGGIVAVVLVDIYAASFEGAVAGIDYSPPAVAALAALFIGTLYRDDLSRYVPVARMHVVESLSHPVVVLNPDREVVDYNPAAETLLEGGDPTGERFDDATPPGVVPADIETAERSGGTEVVVGGAQSTVYDVAVTRVVDDGTRAGMALVFTDITELRERTADLRHESERLDEFASTVSHDLRNPLQVAYGNLELIDDEETEPVRDALDRMDEVIDDALTLSREGRAVDERRWEPLAAVALAAWESSRTAAADLSVAVDEDVRVRTDRSRLRTVFENLFRNSVDHGGDDVSVEVGRLGDRGFYVADDGPGIPAADRETVFGKGYTTGEGGTGIGLQIVRTVVDAHGWEITVTESDEGGARFEITGVGVRSGSEPPES